MTWCEESGVGFVFGLAPNERLKAVLAPEAWEAERRCETTGKAARVFKDFAYRTEKTWSRARRVVGKAEHLPGGANLRFVVTSLPRTRIDARALYEDLYCARGEMENRIKEQQLDLFADRTSSATMTANQLRLWFSSMAYVLLNELRRIALRHTRFHSTNRHGGFEKCGLGPTSPVRRHRFTHLIAVEAATPKRRAAERRDRPLSTADTSRSRRSLERGFVMQAGLLHQPPP